MLNPLRHRLAIAATLIGAALASATGATSAQERDNPLEACVSSRGGATNTVQPVIIVIPFTKEGEDMRTVLEADPMRRVAVTAVKEGFDNLDFSTVDLRGVMDAVSRSGALAMDAESDFKSRVIEQSRADIYVEVEVLDPEVDGDVLNASVIRTAYLTTNGLSMSNSIGYSGRFRGVAEGRLVERAATDGLDAFLATMQRGFDDMVDNGAVVSVEITVAQDAEFDLESEVGPDAELLGFVLEDWFADNAWYGDYNISGWNNLRMILDSVKIPLRDPETCRNYNPSQFARELIRFLRGVDVRARPTISRGLIVIEIQ